MAGLVQIIPTHSKLKSPSYLIIPGRETNKEQQQQKEALKARLNIQRLVKSLKEPIFTSTQNLVKKKKNCMCRIQRINWLLLTLHRTPTEELPGGNTAFEF